MRRRYVQAPRYSSGTQLRYAKKSPVSTQKYPILPSKRALLTFLLRSACGAARGHAAKAAPEARVQDGGERSKNVSRALFEGNIGLF